MSFPIDIDCHFTQEELLAKEICTELVESNDQLANVLMKYLKGPWIIFVPSFAHTICMLQLEGQC